MKIRILFITALLFSAYFLGAEDFAVISYAEGTGFTVVSGGESFSYNIESGNVIGLPLKEGDMVLTDDSTFLEIELKAGNGGVIKVSENTTMTISSLDENGGGVIKVVYGRIRLKLGALLKGSKFWVSGYDTVAGVRGTDFGYDLFYDKTDKTAEKETYVYCFEGLVEVLQYNPDKKSKVSLMSEKPYLLKPGRMIKTTSLSLGTELKAVPIYKSITDYWDLYPFMTYGFSTDIPEKNIQKEFSEGTNSTVSEDLSLDPEIAEKKQNYETGGKIVFGLGLGMLTAGGLLHAFLPSDNPAYGLSVGLMSLGGVASVAGGGMILYSVSLK